MPKVTVVSPTYNHAKYLRRSVASVLNQTYLDFEYIISDDCSSDNTLEVLAEFNDPRLIVLANDHNAGITGNSWRCWARCTGEYLIGFTTDDEWKPNLLERLVSELDSDPELLGVFATSEFINEAGELNGEYWSDEGVGLNRYELLRAIWMQRPIFCAPTGMFRTDALRKVGYFPKHYKQINDLAGFLGILGLGNMKVLPDRLMRFRWRDDNQNTSAPTPQALSRFAFEMYQMLFYFADNVADLDMLLKIFPEARKFADPERMKIKEYYLARLALEFPHGSYKLFGLTLLHRLLADDTSANILASECNFSYPELFVLAGDASAIADPYLMGQYEHLKALTIQQQYQLNALQSQVASLESQCAEFQRQQAELMNSTSWKITAPLRQFRTVLGSGAGN